MTGFMDDYGNRLFSIHSPIQCVGKPCVIHRPSKHHLRSWPLRWSNDKRMFQRVCEHGFDHPDPDDLQWQISYLENMNAELHLCDGCCRAKPEAAAA